MKRRKRYWKDSEKLEGSFNSVCLSILYKETQGPDKLVSH